MNTIENFIEFVKLEYSEEKKCYGHFPFVMSVLTYKNEYELYMLMDAESVKQVYDLFLMNARKKAKKIYFSIDFPAIMDAKHDFILITQYELKNMLKSSENVLKFYSIPYDTKTGKRFEVETTDKNYVLVCSLQFQAYIIDRTKAKYKVQFN